jgi:modification methylase
VTSTSNFGVSRRENHDARPFYERFPVPKVSADERVESCSAANSLFVGDSRHMKQVATNSVALVVTSPPYHNGKLYEEELGAGHVPSTYVEYLKQLTEVFAECQRVLEPGGRIAVNVANLGRKPYRSLSADVIRILEEELGFLLRAEIIWQKGAGASGSCAWGSFMKPSNPVLRDVTERIVVASKGRFDRAPDVKTRKRTGLPHEPTIAKDDFMSWTLDVWHMPAESATRVGHPAPFPIELPRRLIELYTYENDVVLDPYMGSGSTALACVETERRYVGYDTDDSYVDLSRKRVQDAQTRRGDHAA